MLKYRVSAHRVDAHGGEAATKKAILTLVADGNGRVEAFNPVELLLPSLAACTIKGIERVAPILKFEFRGVEVKLHGIRQDRSPKMVSITYELVVDTDEPDRRLDLLHENIRKFGTISNTVAEATKLEGQIKRRGA